VTTAGRQWLRIACVITCYGLLIFAGQTVSEWALHHLEVDLRPAKQAMIHWMVMAAVMLYILLLALPFMPGVEIGLGLMVMLGPSICLLVYLGTVIALTLAFALGRLVPMAMIVTTFEWLGLRRASAMVTEFAALSANERLTFLLSRVPTRFLSHLLRHRYLALAVLLNVPGNALIGGGGGIALVAGISRLFNGPAFVLTVALAVSPVPLIYYLVGGFK
jgi:hypothetical protein